MLLRLLGATRQPVVYPLTPLRPWRAFGAAAEAAASSHYEVLGVSRPATPADIKAAFRQRAKALHPDLTTHLGKSDAQDFLRLVAAYEVLADPQQRRLYDAATDPQLPRTLRRAAAAQAQAGAAAGTAQEDADAGLNWRWGMADWARHGPAAATPAQGGGGAQGPSPPGASADPSLGPLRVSLLSALRRHQSDLQVELHAALMTAFLGPRLELQPGELPSSLELDERSHPSLTDDLLHLVHGRTLLGVVQPPTTLRLEGSGQPAPQLAHSSSAGLLQPSLQLPVSSVAQSSSDTQGKVGGSTQETPTPQACSGTATMCQGSPDRQQHQAAGGRGAAAASTAAAGAAAAGGRSASHSSSAAAADAAGDAEISDAEWRQLLQEQHPLTGSYDWWPPPDDASGSNAAAAAAGAAAGSHEQQGSGSGGAWVEAGSTGREHLAGAGGCSAAPSGGSSEDATPWQQQGQEEPAAAGAAAAAHGVEGLLGGRAARAAWEQQQQGQEHEGAVLGIAHAGQPADLEADGLVGLGRAPAGAMSDSSSSSSMEAGWSLDIGSQQQQQQSWQQQWHQLDAAGQVQVQQQWHKQWQKQQEEQQQRKQQWLDEQQWQDQRQQQEQQEQQPPPPQQQQQQQQSLHSRQQQHQQHQGGGQQQSHHNDEQQQQQQQQRGDARQRPPRSGHRRLWRWLRSPSPDWLAADWSFSDGSEGVLVLRLVQEGAVTAVGLRDDTQPNKPIKVYVDGVLYAAVLEDVVLQPLTGKLMAVLYRFYTPGVHHLYAYLPNTPGGSRVLARMLRRWMPPSSTWLFPPRAQSHDRCSWLLEWEGFRTQHRPGWMHPAVYVLTAAFYSYDIEARRLDRTAAGSLQQWCEDMTSRAAWAARQAWSVGRNFLRRTAARVSG